MAVGTIGTMAPATGTPRPRSFSQRITPSAADRPNADPPLRQIASMRSLRAAGSSRSVSRGPGAPPRRPADRPPRRGLAQHDADARAQALVLDIADQDAVHVGDEIARARAKHGQSSCNVSALRY